MKRFIHAALALTLFAGLAGCSSSGSDSTPTPTPTPAASSTSAATEESEEIDRTFEDYWNGDWYGYWIGESGTGDFSDFGDGYHYWDIGCEILLKDDQTGKFILWDEDWSRTNPMCELDVTVDTSLYKQGSLVSVDGYFYDMEIGEGDWTIDPENTSYDHLVVFTTTYTDPSNSDNTLEFSLIMRPWGMKWDDIEESGQPWTYSFWYLPLIEAGEDMPDEIDTSGAEATSQAENTEEAQAEETAQATVKSLF
jgi:hypothetical protein